MDDRSKIRNTPYLNLVLGLISGPTIYMIQFFIVYLLVEAGCRSGLYRTQILGFSIVNVLVVVVTLIAAGLTGAMTWISYRRWQESRQPSGEEVDSYSGFLTFAGTGLNGYSTLVILLTGLPTLSVVLCEWI